MNSGDLAIILILSLLAHGWGDYIIQTDWMANAKTEHWLPAIAHAMSYTLPFVALVLTMPARPWPGVAALAVIGGTHAVIDRYRLARHLIWARNWLGGTRLPWSECSETGFPPDQPEWLTKWLMIIVDNLIHITINSLVIIWLARYGA